MSKDMRLKDIEYCAQRLYELLQHAGAADNAAVYVNAIIANATQLANGGEEA